MKYFTKYLTIFFDALKGGQFKYAFMVLHMIVFGKDIKEE